MQVALWTRKAGRLTAHLHLFLFTPSSAADHLLQTFFVSYPISSGWWRPYLQPSPPLTLSFCPPAAAGILWEPSSQVGQRSKKPAKQAGNPQIFTFPPLLQIPKSHPNLCRWQPVWPFLTLCPHSQENKYILVEHPTVLLPMDLLTTPLLAYPHA